MRWHRLALAFLAVTQVAWSQYFTSRGMPVRWNRPEVVVLMDAAGTADVPGDLEFAAVVRSMDTWNAVECPHPQLVDGGRVTGVKPGSDTGKNLLIWVANPADWSTPEMDHVIALTTLYYDDRSGIAAKFDMEFADFDYEFSVTDVGPLIRTDLENTTTHEFGHVLGLDHSTEPEATMYYTASPGDTSKRTLAQDDITGLCAIYFAWAVPPPDSSSSVEGGLVVEERGSTSGGCRVGPGRGASVSSLIPVAFLFILFFCAVRRRRIRSWSLLCGIVLIGPGWAPLTSEDGTPLRWRTDRVVFALDLSSGTGDVDGDTEWDILDVAMSVWNEVPCGQPHLEGSRGLLATSDKGPITNTISFREDIEEFGLLAYTLNTFIESDGEITASSIVFNDQRRFTHRSDEVNIDLGSVAVHEMGHSLGLGHSERFGATMYPSYFPGTTFGRDLHEDDAAGLCALYGRTLPADWSSSWPWQDPPSPLQCEDGCEAIPTGLPALQATWPRYEISGRRGCAAGGGGWGGMIPIGASVWVLSTVGRIRARRS